MAEDTSTPPKSTLRAIGELGPAWITSITGVIVALATAGFFVGHVTADSNVMPQPTVTVTKTIDSGAAARPSATATTASGAADMDGVRSVPAPADGTLLGSYSIDLSEGYSAPLGPSQPSQAQFTQTMSAGDVLYDGWNYSAGRSSERIVSLPVGTTPTYRACSTGTTFTSYVASAVGASFCVLEVSGKLAGVNVLAEQTGHVLLQVSVWQRTSP